MKSSVINKMPEEIGTHRVNIQRYREAQYLQQQDEIATETPVCLSYNGIAHAVMLLTPKDLQDFAIGFSFTEAIIQHKSDIYGIEILQRPEGIELALEISNRAFAQLKNKRRVMHGRTGCGICGKQSLEQLTPEATTVNGDFVINTSILQHAMTGLEQVQALNNKTGSVHAAAWCDLQGNILHIREDVGRHNALDKLLGLLASTEFDANAGFVLMTSRISYELVVKATAMGISLLAAISAPTSLAVELATQARQTLIGFVRPGSYVIYSQPDRINNS